MDLGSGNDILMNSSVAGPHASHQTTLVPNEKRPKEVIIRNFLNTSSSLYTRLASFPVQATTSNNFETSQNRQFHTFSVNQPASTERRDGFNATNATLSPGPMEGNHVVLIVGLTCGLLGLLLGVLLTVGVGMYINKRRNKAATSDRRRSGYEKNPKEMTFEPIDLSLTLPSYVEEPRSPERRKSHASNFLNSASETSTTLFASAEKDSHSQSMHSLRSKRNSQDNKGYLPSSENEDRLNEIICDQGRGNNHELALEHSLHRTDTIREIKRATSTRDSFSSGLGTGTESDIIPSETGETHLTRKVMPEPSQLQGDVSIAQKTRYIRNERKRRSYNRAMGVRGCVSRRSLQPSQQKRSLHKSGTWSVRGSRGKEWSVINTFLPAGPDAFSATDFSMTSPESISSSFTTESTKTSGVDEKLKHNKKNDVKLENKTNKDETSEAENEVAREDNIVSTYFNIHFPPVTPVVSTAMKTLPISTNTLLKAEVHVRKDRDIKTDS